MQQIYSIRDAKAETYHQPFFMVNEATAARAVAAAVNEEGHDFHRYVEDYSLWRLGEFNPETGEIFSTVPEHLFNLIALQNKPARPAIQEVE